MNEQSPFPVYEAALQEIQTDPYTVIRERRLEQVMALLLTLPDEIRARERMRRSEYEKFETCMNDIKKLQKTIEHAVKTERDLANKLKYPNKEIRAVEEQARLESDPVFVQRERMRRVMYSQVKYYDEEIGYLNRMHESLLEVTGLFTAMVEFESRTGKKPAALQGRAARRAGERHHARSTERNGENISIA